MAYAFNGASLQYLSTASAPATGTPMTIACWFRPTVNANGVLVSVGVSGATHRNQIQMGAGPVLVTVATGTIGLAVNASGVTVGAWNHGASVFSSPTSRNGWVNGVAGPLNTQDVGTQQTFNSVAIGVRWATTLGNYFTGELADVGVWNVALNADEIASLSRGVRCLAVRPQSLVFYAPLVRDLVDLRGGLAITNTNAATVVKHPRVYG